MLAQSAKLFAQPAPKLASTGGAILLFGEACGLKTSKHPPTRNSAAQLQRSARERADEQARRIPWQRLFDARNQYIDWQEFYLWVRLIVEIENCIPPWLGEILNERCPGFVESEQELAPKAATGKPLPLRLEDWIDQHVFSFAKQEGWFSAITYYAIRDPRYQRAKVCWSESVEKWKQAKPSRYPSFEEWKRMAAECDDTAHLVPAERKAQACTKLVAPDRLAEAVSRYIDWEAFAYWVRPALEGGGGLPDEVVSEFGRRCPGFLEAYPDTRDWQQLLSWIVERHFADAKREGWFDAVLIHAHSHPRAIRTMEYADHCDEMAGSPGPEPYPSFADWRCAADAFVEPAVLPGALHS